MIDIGSVVNGKYRLVRLLGEGGMGSVYEAVHAVLGTRVAIKVLHPELSRRTGLVERFLQEARVAAQIRSSHVVQVTDVDRTPEAHAYIVMELLEGEPLSTLLDREHRLAVPTAAEYALQILSALEAAHALGVIHRDLKPENVFITFLAGKPVLKLIDFGIAKARRTDPHQRNLTVAGVVMGTAEYMAPEQARSADKVDARSDLYAVGVMLYEMLAGSRPVSGEDARIVAVRVERGEVVPLVRVAPEVPREIAGLVHRAMAARPELRFASATEMRVALENALAGRRPAGASLPGSVAASSAAPSGTPEVSPGGTLRNLPAMQVLQQGRTGSAGTQTPPGDGQGGDAPESPPRTQRAPPMATALAPTPYAAVSVPSAPTGDPRSRGRNRTWAMVALPLLLGAGIVGALIATGAWSPAGGGSENPSAGSPRGDGDAIAAMPSTASPPPATLAPAVSTSLVVPPFQQSRTLNVPHPSGSPHAVPSPAPSAVPEAGLPPPFVFPSTLPTSIPGLPLPLPSGFPTAFPSMLPPWPTAPPAPSASSPGAAPTAPTAAASAKEPGYY